MCDPRPPSTGCSPEGVWSPTGCSLAEDVWFPHPQTAHQQRVCGPPSSFSPGDPTLWELVTIFSIVHNKSVFIWHSMKKTRGTLGTHRISVETFSTRHIKGFHRSLEHTFCFYSIFAPERGSHASQVTLKLTVSGRMASNSCLYFWVLGLQACTIKIHCNLYFKGIVEKYVSSKSLLSGSSFLERASELMSGNGLDHTNAIWQKQKLAA